MEVFILSSLIAQAIWTVTLVLGSAADAVTHRERASIHWSVPALPAVDFPESVYDRQDAAQPLDEEVFPRAA